MHDLLSQQPLLNKGALLGGCIRLQEVFDTEAVQLELGQLPQDFWGSRGGRVGVHHQAQAVFLRGYAPAEGDRPLEERPALAFLPRIRNLIESIPAQPMRCLMARLPPLGRVAPHIDQGDYFARTIRLHFPIISNERAEMYCGGRIYNMRPGEIWALNNCTEHAVFNGSESQARTHLICDFLLSPQLAILLGNGARSLGMRELDLSRFSAKPAAASDIDASRPMA